MHHTCTNHVSTTQTMIHQDVPTSPYHKPNVCANSSTIYPNMYLNHIPKRYTNVTNKSPLSIHHTIHDPNTINPYIKTCAKTSLLCSLMCVSIIYQYHSQILLPMYHKIHQYNSHMYQPCTTPYLPETNQQLH